MPSAMMHLKASDYLRSPWKNGLGHTDQIAIHPPGSDLRRGDYLWRLSTARIAKSAPFSVFPEHDRVLIVLQGEGVTLSHTFVEGEEAEIVPVPAFEPYEFPGDVPTRCELDGGSIQDLSIFLRKGEVSVQAEAITLGPEETFEWEPHGRTEFLFIAEGTVIAAALRLASPEALRVDRGAEAPVMVSAQGGEARLVVIRIDHD